MLSCFNALMKKMKPQEILDNLSTHLKNTIARAIRLASTFRMTSVTPSHFLLALIQEKGSVGSEVLKKLKLTEDLVVQTIEQSTKPSEKEPPLADGTATVPELNDNARSVLEKAMLIAYEHEHNFVGTEHLLYGLLEVNDEELHGIFAAANISPAAMEDMVFSAIHSTDKFPDFDDVSQAIEDVQDLADNAASSMNTSSVRTPMHGRGGSAVETFTTDLTDKKVQETIDPVIGREKEIDRLINILCRRTKNNPVLVGEPGVGKTAIVEGLAKRIMEKNIPDALLGKKIRSLDLTLLVSGTIYRGEFEARIKQLMEELSRSEDTILFIDELHNIIGAGGSQGTMDAANILKPALARGQLRCIGATTHDEYKKHIHADPALERRFQSIIVDEPSRDDTIAILQGIAPNYERYHGVRIPKHIIETAVDLSIRYIHDNFLPDKAIDLLDEAAAAVRVRRKMDPIKKIYQELSELFLRFQKEKEDAILNEQFEQATHLKKKLEDAKKKLAQLEEKLKAKKPARITQSVTTQEIATILTRRLGLSTEQILTEDYTRLDALSGYLRARLFGQEAVIHRVIDTLRHQYLGLGSEQKPLASFLFAGPSGVGKTALARHIAEGLYHDPQSLITFDMSEFSEGHGVSKLLGSPAGYIGHKDRNKFTEQMKRRPYSVLLFDEIDKAHPDVVRLLLQMLDQGTLTDSSGEKISLRHAVIILTSNVGAEQYRSHRFGFGEQGNAKVAEERNAVINAKLKDAFSAPLLGRLDAICLFEPLSDKAVEQIVSASIDGMSKQLLTKREITITADAEAIRSLAKTIRNPDIGVRNAEHIIAKTLDALLIAVIQQEKKKRHYRIIQKQQGTYALI